MPPAEGGGMEIYMKATHMVKIGGKYYAPGTELPKRSTAKGGGKGNKNESVEK